MLGRRAARFAAAAAFISGGVLTGMTVLSPAAQAVGVAKPLPGDYGCPPPLQLNLAPLAQDRVFFDFDYFDNVNVAANPPLSSLPNAGCGSLGFQLFGFTPSTSVTALPTTTLTLPDGSLLFELPQVPCGTPLSVYVSASGLTGASPPSNIVTLTSPCYTAITSPQQAQGMLSGGGPLFYNDPLIGAQPVTLPSGPLGSWDGQNGQPLPAGTGLFVPAAPPSQ